jgi:hypothetical protein
LPPVVITASSAKRHHEIKVLRRSGLVERDLDLVNLHEIFGIFFGVRHCTTGEAEYEHRGDH